MTAVLTCSWLSALCAS